MSNHTPNVGDTIVVDPGRGHTYGLVVTQVFPNGWVTGRRVQVDGAQSRKWLGQTTPFRPDAVRGITVVK